MIQLLRGDCREMLASLPAASVQCVVTSPPYYGLRDYGHAGQVGLEKTPEAYIAELVKVFAQVRRVMREDATLWLNLGDCFLNKQLQQIPARVAMALQSDGWILRSEIIWAKAAPMPESVRDRPTCAHEKVWLLAKSPVYYFDAEAIREPASTNSHGGKPIEGGPKQAALGQQRGGRMGMPATEAGRNARNVWVLGPEPSGFAHYAMMPTRLAERCIKAGTSDKGCCPVCGAPWARVVEREAGRAGDRSSYAAGMGDVAGARTRTRGDCYPGAAVTVGWAHSCPCPPHEPVPCTVLDPFGGGGTTGLVADRLGRSAVLIELNPNYAAIAADRLQGDCPMFAELCA